MNESIINRIDSALNERFKDTDMFLVDVKFPKPTTIEVYIDGMQNVTIDQCAKTSRYLEEILETESLVPEKYVLEVSSPGMDNAFKVNQQYQKNLGRNIEVLSFDGIKREGLLVQLNDNGFVIEHHKQVKKSKTPEITQYQYTFDEVKQAKKVFTFPKIK